MSDIYVSLNDAAQFEGMSYTGLVSRVQRRPDGYLTMTEPRGLDGGKDRVLVALSSLSAKARRAYKATQKVDGRDAVIEARANQEVPWYVDADIHWYMENNRDQYDKALELSDQIRRFLDRPEAERTSSAEAFAAELGISQRTLYRNAEGYLEASAWALRIGQETGQNYDFFKVLALCRKPKLSGTFPSLPPEQRALIENIWFDKDFIKNRISMDTLYEVFSEKAEKNGWTYPSYQTVTRYINYLMNEKRYGNARVLAGEGLLAYKNKVMRKAIRDTSAVPVMGIIQGDSHTFDFFVKYVDPVNGKVSAIRPTLVAWIDTRSRVVMGTVMDKNINAQAIKYSMLKVVYQYGVPECILIDNGKDYTAHEMTGRERKERSGLLALDSAATGFYRSLGIKDDYRALPYQPWSKGHIERFFGGVCEKFSKRFFSYTGTLTGSKTVAKVEKDIDGMLKHDELLTMEEVSSLFQKWLDEQYHQSEHRGLKKMHEKWTKPIELFENAEGRYCMPPPPIEFAETLLMKAKAARVYSIGITQFGETYMANELDCYIGTTVNIRWNPSDMSKIAVFTLKGKKICDAKKVTMLSFYGWGSQTALEDHVRSQNRQISHDRAIIAESQAPYEQRVKGELPPPVGAMDFIIKNQKPQKVVSLPTDTQYREQVTAKNTSNEYLEKKGKEALAKLAALG